MKSIEVESELQKVEYACRRCEIRWTVTEPQNCIRCPACPSEYIERVSGELERFKMFWEKLDPVLRSLTYRERKIVKLRYGADPEWTYTQEQTGRIFKRTRQRICQIEKRIVRKLAHPVRLEKLRKAGLLSPYARQTMPFGLARLMSRIAG